MNADGSSWREQFPKQQKAEIYKAIHAEMQNLKQQYQRNDISEAELKECALAIITLVWKQAPSSTEFASRLSEIPKKFFESNEFAQEILQPIRLKHQKDNNSAQQNHSAAPQVPTLPISLPVNLPTTTVPTMTLPMTNPTVNPTANLPIGAATANLLQLFQTAQSTNVNYQLAAELAAQKLKRQQELAAAQKLSATIPTASTTATTAPVATTNSTASTINSASIANPSNPQTNSHVSTKPTFEQFLEARDSFLQNEKFMPSFINSWEHMSAPSQELKARSDALQRTFREIASQFKDLANKSNQEALQFYSKLSDVKATTAMKLADQLRLYVLKNKLASAPTVPTPSTTANKPLPNPTVTASNVTTAPTMLKQNTKTSPIGAPDAHTTPTNIGISPKMVSTNTTAATVTAPRQSIPAQVASAKPPLPHTSTTSTNTINIATTTATTTTHTVPSQTNPSAAISTPSHSIESTALINTGTNCKETLDFFLKSGDSFSKEHPVKLYENLNQLDKSYFSKEIFEMLPNKDKNSMEYFAANPFYFVNSVQQTHRETTVQIETVPKLVKFCQPKRQKLYSLTPQQSQPSSNSSSTNTSSSSSTNTESNPVEKITVIEKYMTNSVPKQLKDFAIFLKPIEDHCFEYIDDSICDLQRKLFIYTAPIQEEMIGTHCKYLFYECISENEKQESKKHPILWRYPVFRIRDALRLYKYKLKLIQNLEREVGNCSIQLLQQFSLAPNQRVALYQMHCKIYQNEYMDQLQLHVQMQICLQQVLFIELPVLQIDMKLISFAEMASNSSSNSTVAKSTSATAAQGIEKLLEDSYKTNGVLFVEKVQMKEDQNEQLQDALIHTVQQEFWIKLDQYKIWLQEQSGRAHMSAYQQTWSVSYVLQSWFGSCREVYSKQMDE